jgi:signal transduction histidine kinase
VELHDGAGQTMTGLRRRARQIADRARANPRAAEAFRIARITLTAAGRELLGKAAGLTST